MKSGDEERLLDGRLLPDNGSASEILELKENGNPIEEMNTGEG
jgi:hypothetical protein